MRLSSLVFTALGLALAAAAATVPAKRQVILAPSGTTVAPPDGSTIAPGSSFPFEYRPTNYCHSGYSPISVYLSTAAPTSADITGGGALAEGSFVFKFGDYLYANFGLPQMGSPPPATLTLPTFDGIEDGTTLYFSVIETYRDCPGHVALEFGLETTTLVSA
ncbi:hypothetical protein C8Q74DRAFT_1220476 [Fomes fomentarius]|nr:hypothetical protein C8Q74DRAFT_1220476 [Fomes fomentarius]